MAVSPTARQLAAGVSYVIQSGLTMTREDVFFTFDADQKMPGEHGTCLLLVPPLSFFAMASPVVRLLLHSLCRTKEMTCS